jgi:hypothetical protein
MAAHIYTWKMEETENGNFCFVAANRKWKRQTSSGFLQTEMENRILFPLVSK